MHTPLVSTLICTYNAEPFFDATIRSVLGQTYTHQEILIRDDGSSDGTVELLTQRSKKDARIRIFVEPWVKRGPYGGLNYLLDHAQGTYIAIQDHDDIWHPEKLEKQVEFLEEDSEYEGCGTYTIYRYEWEDRFVKQPMSYHRTKDIPWHTSLVFRNNTLYRYNTHKKTYTDYHFMNKILWKLWIIPSYDCVHKFRADEWNAMNAWWKNIIELYIQLYNSWYNRPKDLVTYIYSIYMKIFPRLSLFLSKNVFSRKIRQERESLTFSAPQAEEEYPSKHDLQRLTSYIWVKHIP